MNNFSPLPFYESVQEQNARKWWAYGRIYPLFAPNTTLLPFQIIRPKATLEDIIDSGNQMIATDTRTGYAIEYNGGLAYSIVSAQAHDVVEFYDVSELRGVFFYDLPKGIEIGIPVNLVFVDSDDNVISAENLIVPDSTYNGAVWVPEGAREMIVQAENHDDQSGPVTVNEAEVVTTTRPISEIFLYDKDGEFIADLLMDLVAGIEIKNIGDYDYICYAGTEASVIPHLIGQYYLEISDGESNWYSEVFTLVADMEPYIKLEWWDSADFVMDAGTIVYQMPNGAEYHNFLYLDADLAKPEYLFEEEVEERDGYTFPEKQISEKRYKFTFLASEYLLDCLRFVRMSDYVRITAGGREYVPDSFLLTPEWESEGDVAVARVEFDTDTVAKKTGLGYLRAAGN